VLADGGNHLKEENTEAARQSPAICPLNASTKRNGEKICDSSLGTCVTEGADAYICLDKSGEES